jgi:hypothetical protein
MRRSSTERRTPAEAARSTLVEKARGGRTAQREVAYPIDYAIETDERRCSQQDPARRARPQFCAFVNARYGLDWTAEQSSPSTDPNEIRRDCCVERARDFVTPETARAARAASASRAAAIADSIAKLVR